jgi:putative chitinase
MSLLNNKAIEYIFKEVSPNTLHRWVPLLNKAFDKYEINTPRRASSFIAQVGHESGYFRYVKEIWGPTPVQRRYEGRRDLGNTQPGDGKRFMGRGLIQVTGRFNYADCGRYLGLPLLQQPELLEQPENAVNSACWFWHSRNCNSLADMGMFQELTKRINGGLNGYADRYKLYQRATEVIQRDF